MSTRDPSHVMGASRSDPGGGEIPMKATEPFVVCPERKAISPVRGVVDKYDSEIYILNEYKFRRKTTISVDS